MLTSSIVKLPANFGPCVLAGKLYSGDRWQWKVLRMDNMIHRKMPLILLDLCQTLTQDLSMRLMHSTIKTYVTPVCLDLLFDVETISLNGGQINMLLPLNLPSRRYKYIFYYSVCGSCVLSTLAANKRLAEFFPVTRPLAPHPIIIHDFPEIAGDHKRSSNFKDH